MIQRTYLQNINRLTDTEKINLQLPKGKKGDKLGVWDEQIHITICKIDN